MSYNTDLQTNNDELQTILNTINALPGITPSDIGAATEIHASQHASTGSDPITPESIGAASVSDIPTDVLKYTAQTLSSDQQAQARTNISTNIKTFHTLEQLGLTRGEETLAAIYTALPDGGSLIFRVNSSDSASIYPASYGIFTMDKNGVYAKLSFVSVSSTSGAAGASWAGSMYSADVFSGWHFLSHSRSMTRNTLTISKASSNASYYWKNDAKEVGLIIQCKMNSTLSTGTQIATLPAGYRPTSTILIPLSYNSVRSLRIYSNGKVDFANGSISSGEYIGAGIVFPT